MNASSPLLTEDGQALANSLPPYDAAATETLSKKLRALGHPPDLVSAALTLSRLRERGRNKFGDSAATLFFTEEGLQQATRKVVADLHAARFVKAGCRKVLDLTSGIGADARAFALAGLDVVANDLDLLTARFAALNLAEFSNARVTNEDALSISLDGFDGVFVDPARRNARGRTFDPKDYSPPLDEVLAIRKTVPALGVKVAPGISYAALPEDTHAQWVSVDGDVVEAGLWFGPLARNPGRSALVIRGSDAETMLGPEDPREAVIPLNPAALGKYLYEPDGAVIRSGAIAGLADMLQALPVSENIAYLSGDALVPTVLAQAFEVLDVVPVKQLRKYFAQRDVGILEILKRGFDVDPHLFRKQLKLRGTKSATVILTRLMGRHYAVVVRRIGNV